MKPISIFAIICLSFMLNGCRAQEPLNEPLNEALDVMETGGDRDAQGCIGSAGYQWSAVAEECIRVFERGVALTPLQNLEASTVAYLVVSEDKLQAELFLHEGGVVLLDRSAEHVWDDLKKHYRVKFGASQTYTVYDKDGNRLYAQESDIAALEGQDVTDDWIADTGVFSQIEDSGYPFYSLNVLFPKHELVKPFTLDIESLGLSADRIEGLEGQAVSFEYTSDFEERLADIQLGGASLMGWEDRESLRDYRSTSGILHDAEVTIGDRPTQFYIEAVGGDRVTFKAFVTQELAAANGREVIAYYSTHTSNIIRKLTAD